MNNKLLTVIVPSYNMEEFLPKCLESLIVPDEALLQRLDVIVVNDGSKDRTSEIAHQFEKDYPGVFRVIDKGNGHYGSCINAALPIAAGTFVKIMDADDSFETKGLAKLLDGINTISGDSQSEIDVVITDTLCIDGNGCEVKRLEVGFKVAKEFSLDELNYNQIKNLWMHQVTYRLDIFRKLDYRQSQGIPFTDQEWMFSPMSCVRRACFLPITVYRYLLGREGQTVDKRYYTQHFKVIRELTLNHIAEYSRCLSSATKGGAHYLRERLISRILLVYYRHLLVSRKELTDEMTDFIRFDNVVRSKIPELQKPIEDMRLIRRIPIGFVDAWRRKQSGHPFRYWFLMDVCLPLAQIRVLFAKWLNSLGRQRKEMTTQWPT